MMKPIETTIQRKVEGLIRPASLPPTAPPARAPPIITRATAQTTCPENKKKMAASITNRHIENIYEAAMSTGAYGGKVSGAGGGGFMFFATDPVRKLDLINALGKFNGRVLNFHFSESGCQGWKINETWKR